MQSNEHSKLSRRTRLIFGSDSSRNSSHNANLKKHPDSVESNNLPPPPPPPPRYPLTGDGFSPHTGYGVSSASGEQTPKSPPRTSSLRPRGIPLKREYGSRERIAQPAAYGTGERKSLRKPQIGSSTTSNNSSSERQFPVVDRPSRPFTLTTTNTTNTSTASTNTTPSASSSNEKLTSIAITKHKVDSLCQTDPRSTPLLSRLLAPGFATSVVSSTINTNSNQRKGSFQSCGSSESDRSPVPSSSTPRDLLTEMNRREMGLDGHSLSQVLTSSGEYQKKDGENVSWVIVSSFLKKIVFYKCLVFHFIWLGDIQLLSLLLDNDDLVRFVVKRKEDI
ncbi:unnamed protein product [Trichobilharzia regenti]|nr:unnamed protein product [Trichobilharzia regenti]